MKETNIDSVLKQEALRVLEVFRLGKDTKRHYYTVNYDLYHKNNPNNSSDLKTLLKELGNYTPSILESFSILDSEFYGNHIVSLIENLKSFSKKDKYIIMDYTSNKIYTLGPIDKEHKKALEKHLKSWEFFECGIRKDITV